MIDRILARIAEIDWRAEATLAGKVIVGTLLAATLYAVTWVLVTADAPVTGADVALAVGCVLLGIPAFAAALALAGVRRPWLGGCYVTVLTVLMGAWTAMFRDVADLTPGSWMGVAACVAVIYAMDYGSPTKYPAVDERD